ncbi:MAG: Anti-sigma F factor antagonist [Firmicutes bacterium ADurb.Bin467]|jgi:stage II sporulation protein AA (anti-sigma F factor antagonist)|nr:MAG: Anti-sigma F factor antagonist [Firmicutes bacterium ADurb.Bin467]
MLSYEKYKGKLTVRLKGELDHASIAPIRAELDQLLNDPKVKHLVLDMEGVSFMDSSAIGLVIGRYKALARRGGSVSVTRTAPRVDRIFEMAGLYQIVEKRA